MMAAIGKQEIADRLRDYKAVLDEAHAAVRAKQESGHPEYPWQAGRYEAAVEWVSERLGRLLAHLPPEQKR